MLIGGRLVDAADGAVFDVLNPATEEITGSVADGSGQDVDAAVAAARAAFDAGDWAADRRLRSRVLTQLHEAVLADAQEWRRELVAEVGCPVTLTYGQQLDESVRDNFGWALRMIDEFGWDRELPVVHMRGRDHRAVVTHQPLGVAAAIVPWNFPVEVTLTKVLTLLAAGNTVVLKPAPDTPLNATRLGRLVVEHTDMPPGVFNVVTSADHGVGAVLSAHPAVDAVSFTGSTATGRRIMAAGAPTLKRLFLELGGKSAHIVCDDADVDAVVAGATHSCLHAGQGCALLTRLLLPRSRYAETVDRLGEAYAALPYGEPNDPAVLMGPVISERQRQRVLGYIAKGVAEGARVVAGGGVPEHLTRGYFVQPTLLADVQNHHTVAREEIFGPVLCVIPYDTEDDAVRIANDSAYGLAGAVSAGSTERAMAIARRLRTGVVAVNGGYYFRRDVPFGGFKQSGLGRQCGDEGFASATEIQTFALPA